VSSVIGELPSNPSSAPKPARPATVEEAAQKVRQAAAFVADAEERQAVMVKSLASIFDELKVARRTLGQAEANLLQVSKNTGAFPVSGAKTLSVKAN
jgi:hypothetical protein